MGISFKIFPGVRIGATRRGMNASFGPRAARIHLGPGGVRYSSGIGPVTISGGGRGRYSQPSWPSANDESVDWSAYERNPDGHPYPVHQVKLVLNMAQGNTNGKYWDVVYTKGRNKVIASVKDHDEANLIARALIPLPKKKRKHSNKKLEVSKIKEIRPKGYFNEVTETPNVTIFVNRGNPDLPVARSAWLKEKKIWQTKIYANKKAALLGADDELFALEHAVDGNEATRWTYEHLNSLISGK